MPRPLVVSRPAKIPIWYSKKMSVVASCLALALALALSAGGCGRIGYEALSSGDADPNEADADPNAPIVDASGSDGGASLQCQGDPGPNCVGSTVGTNIGGSSILGTNLQNYAVPLIPECGVGPVSETRNRIIAPSAPARLTFEVAADTDIILSVFADDCDGASLRCTMIPANGNEAVEIISQPGESFLVSTASNDSCGDVQLTVRAFSL